MDQKTIAIAGGDKTVYDLVDQFSEGVLFDVFSTEPKSRKFNQNVNYVEVKSDREAANLAVQDVVNGADILFKGLVQTHTLLKEVLLEKKRLVHKNLLSHVALLDIPGQNRPVLLTDAAMNIEPSFDQMLLIIENAVDVALSLSIKRPKVAILSSAENFNPKMPSSVRGRELMIYYQNNPICADIYGPISLDLAMSTQVVAKKHFDGFVAGNADILVVPNIDVGNVLYKSLTLFTDTKVGGMIVGANVPIVLTSRGDSLENKQTSLQFALDVVQK